MTHPNGLDDDAIAQKLGLPQRQQAHSRCRQLEREGVVEGRSIGGKIVLLPTFEQQMESGLFGSWLWDDRGNRSPDWNPIERPLGNWHVYRDMLSKIARIDREAMSNFLPWGSKNADALIEGLCAAHRPLLDRMFEFADDLNAEIVQALAPKLLVVPFRLDRNSRFDGVRPFGLALARAVDSREHMVASSQGAFRFYTGHCREGG